MIFIEKHKILIFYFATFCLTGILFCVQMLLLPHAAIQMYLFSPAIVALFMVTITSKRQGLINFIKGLVHIQTKFSWLAISILLPAVIVLGGISLFHIYSGGGIKLSVTPLEIGSVMVITMGCIGEELGWRAYLLPLLLRKYTKIYASILMGILWGLWHVVNYREGIGFILFVLSTIGMSIIMT